ncbi:MAG: phage tail tape measure protein [Oligosphaeraceae bacterium]
MSGTVPSDKFAAYSYPQVVLESDGFLKDLNGLEDKTRNFAKACAKFGQPLQDIGEKMLAPFAGGVKAFAGFDDVMRRVGAVTGATGDNLKELNDLARELGASTAFTSSQVASGMQSLGMMGFSPEEIKEATGTIMALSQATGTDLATAATIAANNLRVFGLGAQDIGPASDYLAATANGSAQTLTDLGEALKTAGPAASSVGQSLRQTSAALGVLANMGIRGSVAGSALARSYRQVAFLASGRLNSAERPFHQRNRRICAPLPRPSKLRCFFVPNSEKTLAGKGR